MKCANCDKDAFYVYQLTASKTILYCAVHLPKFLEQAKNAGLLKKTDALKAAVEEGLKNITTPKVEETVVEAPKKKATKKKAE